MASEISILQALRLKGRPGPTEIATAVGCGEDDALLALEALAAKGACEEVSGRFAISPQGRDLLESKIAAERESIDARGISSVYEEFTSHNSELKRVVTAWQLRQGEPNDHSDAVYDQRVVERLVRLHGGCEEMYVRLGELNQRLTPYRDRFTRAIEQIERGDHTWIAKPIADSYHTVWFELHEELIGLLGLDRQAEAAAGRAE